MTKRNIMKPGEESKRQYQFVVQSAERPYIWDVMQRLKSHNIECVVFIREDLSTVLCINVNEEEHSNNHNAGFLLGYLLGVTMMVCAQQHETPVIPS
jgi:hypothetical protein